MTTQRTEVYRFLGMNIRGTPAMRMSKVASDLVVGMRKSDVLALQEFRWPWYWRQLAKAVPDVPRMGWRTSPGKTKGLAQPVFGAQAVCWRANKWKKITTRTMLLHAGEAGISENRYIRGVLLEDRKTGLRCWFVSCHFVVGGDEVRDSARRRGLLRQDLNVMRRFIKKLKLTGYPMLLQGDLNIHMGTEGYRLLEDIIKELDLQTHGHRGVEYLFSMDNRKGEVKVHGAWIVPTSQIFTDHEGRGVDFTLEG